MNEIKTYYVELKVKIRKYDVDIKELQYLLRTHKWLSNNKISEMLKIPLTQVQHYFRTDKYFAIPDPSVWFKLKKILNINNDSFDKSITTFVEQPNQFDMGNRLYDSRGIMPTILADSGNKLILIKENNEKLSK